jgi:hypothetical protein
LRLALEQANPNIHMHATLSKMELVLYMMYSCFSKFDWFILVSWDKIQGNLAKTILVTTSTYSPIKI